MSVAQPAGTQPMRSGETNAQKTFNQAALTKLDKAKLSHLRRVYAAVPDSGEDVGEEAIRADEAVVTGKVL